MAWMVVSREYLVMKVKGEVVMVMASVDIWMF